MPICIGREFGSGGHEIAEKLAKRMGMGFYDQELVESAMERSMLSMEKLQKADERRTNPFLHDVHYNMEDRELRGLSTNDILFKVQSKIVLELAQEESVFVGRCADYILKQNNIPCISLFIAAPFEERVQRKMKLLGLDENRRRRWSARRIRREKTITIIIPGADGDGRTIIISASTALSWVLKRPWICWPKS